MSNTKTSTADTILDALNLDAFEPEEQQEMLLTLSDLIFRGSLVRLIERMDEQTKTDFSALVEKGASGEEIEAFIKERVPEGDSAVTDTVKELAEDMAAVAA